MAAVKLESVTMKPQPAAVNTHDVYSRLLDPMSSYDV